MVKQTVKGYVQANQFVLEMLGFQCPNTKNYSSTKKHLLAKKIQNCIFFNVVYILKL